MAKLRADPITDRDLARFVADDSDFAFEMQVLTELRNLGFDCSHSGTYQDPVTSKIRPGAPRSRGFRGPGISPSILLVHSSHL